MEEKLPPCEQQGGTQMLVLGDLQPVLLAAFYSQFSDQFEGRFMGRGGSGGGEGGRGGGGGGAPFGQFPTLPPKF